MKNSQVLNSHTRTLVADRRLLTRWQNTSAVWRRISEAPFRARNTNWAKCRTAPPSAEMMIEQRLYDAFRSSHRIVLKYRERFTSQMSQLATQLLLFMLIRFTSQMSQLATQLLLFMLIASYSSFSPLSNSALVAIRHSLAAGRSYRPRAFLIAALRTSPSSPGYTDSTT